MLFRSSAHAALAASGLIERYPEVAMLALQAGIWGRAVSWDAALGEGDRLEIYRPLAVDPKEARRQRGRRQAERKLASKTKLRGGSPRRTVSGTR